jgi:glutamyl-tRNA reductase
MVGLVGTSFKTAPVNIREKFAFSDEEFQAFAQLLKNEFEDSAVVILSTCNRTEIYFSVQTNDLNAVFQAVKNILRDQKHYEDSLESYFYFRDNKEAAEHLFKVVSGIESLIIGEDQIMGQVKEAFYRAETFNTIDKSLNRLFLKAFETGKKVRTNTSINEGSGSSSSAAVDIVLSHFPVLENKTILIIGAGKTGELVLANLHKRKIGEIYVANRTFAKAVEMSQRFGAFAVKLEDISDIMPKADVIFIATAAKFSLISYMDIKMASLIKASKQVLIDLSVPRNIDAKVENIENIILASIDDLQEIVKKTNKNRKSAISSAVEIIDKMVEEFSEWLLLQEMIPTIKKIKDNLHNINQTELKGFIKVKSLNDPAIVAEYADHITEKFARLLIKNMRDMAHDAANKDLIILANNLLDFNK